MNILILNWRDITHPKSGGAETVTMEHAKAWVREGHRVTWLTSGYAEANPQEKIDGVTIIRRGGSLTVVPYAMFYIFINGSNFDVIVDEIHGIPFFSPLFTRTPVVVFIHEIAGEIWDYMYRYPVSAVGKFMEKLYFHIYRANVFWTDAPSTIPELVKHGISESQCIAIPCPIYIPKVKKVGKEKNPTFIFVSRVVRMKGIEEVIKAFSFIIREKPQAKLWIVGGGDERYVESLKRMLVEYGVDKGVRFFGRVNESEKFELMARAHILLHASVKEGWGLVVLEAASQETPSVVYNVPGLRDVVKDDRTGVVLDTNSPHELAREAVRLINDRNRYARYQKGAKTWVESLDWKEATRRSLDLLEKVARHN